MAAVLPLAALFFCSGCAGLVEIAGQALDGSLFAEKVDAAYRVMPDRGLLVRQVHRKDGDAYITIALDELPALRLYGSLPDTDGGFELTSYTYLASNLTGWNEFRRELSGTGVFRISGDGASFWLDGEPLALDISWGRIRRADTRISGSQALTGLRNRGERIDFLTEWMHRSSENDSLPKEGFPDQKAFEAYWYPILFPELAPSSERPAAWNEGKPDRIAVDDLSWNRDYTKRVFPEELWNVRDSGALLRDWEEAADWIYLQFEWERIMTNLSAGIRLMRIKTPPGK
jgi:hypothetical protein